MKCVAADNLLKGADLIVGRIKRERRNGMGAYVESYLAQYLTVHICGIYEEAIEKIVDEYSGGSGDQRLHRYTTSMVARNFRNPDRKNINQLLKLFDTSWPAQLATLKESRFTAIDNIVTNKNAVAHGTQSSITLDDIFKNFTESKEIIRKIDRMLLGR